MGCRTRVFENRFGPKTSIGRGNISFSTINIVRLAIECMQVENKEERIALFFAKLDHMLELTARQLHERMEFQKTAYAKQFPLLMSSLWLGSEKLKPNDSIASVINQGTLGIGFIGLAECLVALTGKHHGEDKDSQALVASTTRPSQNTKNPFFSRGGIIFFKSVPPLLGDWLHSLSVSVSHRPLRMQVLMALPAYTDKLPLLSIPDR